MGSNVENVKVIIESQVKGTGFDKSSQSIKQLENNLLALQQKATAAKNMTAELSLQNQIMQRRMQSWRGVMSASLPQMEMMGNNLNQMNNRLARTAFNFRMATHGAKGFRMELLGVMFFGMMVANTFKSMLAPAAEAFGLMDLWQDMLLVLFLPIMEKLAPALIDFMSAVMDLPDPVKNFIGILTLLGLAAGFVAFMFSSFALGIGSSILLGWEKFGTVMGNVGKKIWAAKWRLLGFLAAVLTAREIFNRASDSIESFKTSSEEGAKSVALIDEAFQDLINNNSDPFMAMFSDMDEAIVENSERAIWWGATWNNIMGLFIEAASLFSGTMVLIWNSITILIKWAMNSIVKSILKPIKWMEKLLRLVGKSTLADKIAKTYEKIEDATTFDLGIDLADIAKAQKSHQELADKIASAYMSGDDAVQKYRDALTKDKTEADFLEKFTTLPKFNGSQIIASDFNISTTKSTSSEFVSRPKTNTELINIIEVNPQVDLKFEDGVDLSRQLSEFNDKIMNEVDKAYMDNLRRLTN